MLSLMSIMLFMIPLVFFYKNWWIVYNFFMIVILVFFLKVNLFVEVSQQSLIFGIDSISYWLIVLSFWISGLMVMASGKVFFNKMFSEYFILVVLLLLLILIFCFSSLNILVFYVFFESSLLPTLLLILGWGYQPERSQAGMYMIFYTLLASLPLLLVVIYIYKNNNYLYYPLMSWIECSDLIYFSMIMAFLVKLPMYMLHLWLPKAHVEAPIAGSMILAGLLLKLGGYGLMRFMILVSFMGVYLNKYLIVFSLIGGVLVSLLCLRQMDIKSLIAYSSVAHMSLVIAGILTMSYWGMMGSLVLMIGHGLCSSGLFCLANLNYERFMSRSMLINKGGILIFPSLGLWWFLLCSSNMAAPISLNLLGEISILNSLVGYYSGGMMLLMFLSFFSAAYSLFLFSFSQHGKSFCGSLSSEMINFREYQVLFMHWIPLNFLILKGSMFIIY
uniref:NADH-ubiquinone oxidoreductase chain 4 n=2 Tax=Tridactylidae TaxID=58551 RepID=A0A1J0M4K7_9ORTH|nr:NADH dehydrogenase subunit 4 [Xya japonica]APD14938.1 NADH dehydrogenase subunit 4 [Tridactylus sp. NS-2016]